VILQNLIDSEQECLDHVLYAIDALNKFYVEPYFRVSYRDGDSVSKKELPNASTSIIGRVVRNCNSLFHEYYLTKLDVNTSIWEELEEKVKEAINGLSSEGSLKDVLPLKTFGVLPLFSTCYLAEFLDDIDEPLKIPAYAIAIRRILFGVYEERYNENNRIRTDKIHSFLLYRCIKTLIKFTKIVKDAYKEKKIDNIKVFKDNIQNEDLFKDAVNDAYEGHIDKVKEDLNKIYGMGEQWKDFRKEFIEKLFEGDDHGITKIEHLEKYLEGRANSEANTQIFGKFRKPILEIDVSALAFSIGVLSILNNVRYAHTISQGLKIIFESCDNGLWHTVMPFHFDSKGRAIFVPSIEIAVITLVVYLKQLKNNISIPDTELALSSTEMVQKRLCNHYNTIEILNGTEEKIIMQGWSTDKAPSYNRVDSWVTAHVISFLLRRIDLINFAKKKAILDGHSWTPHEKCQPMWDKIVDPDKGLADEGERIKDIIRNAIKRDISNCDKSPMFLLYGPPGTSKTTLVKGIANELGWDLLTLSPSDFIEHSVDKIEEHSRNIFRDLMNPDLDKCIILMDEMDSLFRDRDKIPTGSTLAFVVPAFLPKLQDLRDHIKERNMAVFINTNYYELIDSAISRGGRIDYHLLVLPYSNEAKLELSRKFLRGCDKWIKDNNFTNDGDRIIKNVFECCSPFLTYREIEQLCTLIKIKWPDPTTLKLYEIISPESISPLIYYSRKDEEGKYKALPEICALINRLMNNKKRDFSLQRQNEAIQFLTNAVSTLPNDLSTGPQGRWWEFIDKLIQSYPLVNR